MAILLAAYTPNFEQTAPALFIQLGIIGVLGSVLIQYSRQYCRLAWCLVGIIAGGLAGSLPVFALVVLDRGMSHDIAVVVDFYLFAISAGVGMVVGCLTVATGKMLKYTGIKRTSPQEPEREGGKFKGVGDNASPKT